jgi:hypothetical protein
MLQQADEILNKMQVDEAAVLANKNKNHGSQYTYVFIISIMIAIVFSWYLIKG